MTGNTSLEDGHNPTSVHPTPRSLAAALASARLRRGMRPVISSDTSRRSRLGQSNAEKAKGIKGAATAGGVLIAACAACCAPLVIPPVMAFFAAGGVGFALAGQIGIGLAVLGGLISYIVLRRRAAPKQTAKSGCGFGPVSRCGSVDVVERA